MKKYAKLFSISVLAAFALSVSTPILSQDQNALRPATLPENVSLEDLTLPSASKVIGTTTDNPASPGRDVSYIIDQDQPLDNAYMASFSQTDLAQSFQPGADIICGAGISVFNGGEGDKSVNITIALYDNLPNAGGVMLASGTAAVNLTGTPVWLDVFWPAVPVTPGTTYYLVFTSTNGGGIRGHTSNPYPYGMVFANPGYGPFPNYDYTFRTYTCDAGPTVPLNNWAVFLAIGLIGGVVAWMTFKRS